MGESKLCPACDTAFVKKPKTSARHWSKQIHCSKPCSRGGHRYIVAGVIGGRSRISSHGYRMIYVPFLAGKKSYVYEHRLVMERKLGRSLASHEYVHHINEDKLDNRPENLEALKQSDHQIIHHSGAHDDLIERCLRRGWTQREVVRGLGVSGHRVVRIRQQLRAAA